MGNNTFEQKNIKRINAFVSGQVQGVFFRDSTKEHAKKNGLSGWVKNIEDGRVEVVAEGDEDSLNKFIEFLWRASPMAKVEDVQVEWLEPKGEEDFVVLR